MSSTTTLEYATQQDPDKAAAEPAICARDLNFYFGEGELRTPALVDIQLQIARGEIVIMKGPSGSGKTTLLTLIGTLRTAQEFGSLRVLGRELRGASPSELLLTRRAIGFIFQAHNLFSSLTAFQNVRMGMELFGLPAREMRSRAEYLLSRLGLGNRIDYKPEALSGGQKQRVAVARGLAHRPRLVLADEPTAALDQKSARDVVTLLQQHARDYQTTILIVTHDDRIIDVADRMIKMETGGRIVSNVVVREAERVVRFLKRCRAFERLSVAELAEIGERMIVQRFARGEQILQQGAPGDLFYLIRSGSVDVQVAGAAHGGPPRRVGTLSEGDFFGEAALLTGEPRNASIYALEDTLVYALNNDDFQRVVKSSLSLEEELRKALFDRRS